MFWKANSEFYELIKERAFRIRKDSSVVEPGHCSLNRLAGIEADFGHGNTPIARIKKIRVTSVSPWPELSEEPLLLNWHDCYVPAINRHGRKGSIAGSHLVIVDNNSSRLLPDLDSELIDSAASRQRSIDDSHDELVA